MALDINFNPDDMTIAELEKFEEIADTTLSKMGRSRDLSAKSLKAIVYVVQKRQDPDFTVEDAGQVKIGSLNWQDDEDEGDDDPLPEDESEPSANER